MTAAELHRQVSASRSDPFNLHMEMKLEKAHSRRGHLRGNQTDPFTARRKKLLG